MNIIFGDAVKQLPPEYIVLELDTFLIKPVDQRITTWCVVESVPATELVKLDVNKKLHSNLMVDYRAQDWDRCMNAIKLLRGLWEGEVDTFYDELEKRINQYKLTPVGADWDGTVVKHAELS